MRKGFYEKFPQTNIWRQLPFHEVMPVLPMVSGMLSSAGDNLHISPIKTHTTVSVINDRFSPPSTNQSSALNHVIRIWPIRGQGSARFLLVGGCSYGAGKYSIDNSSGSFEILRTSSWALHCVYTLCISQPRLVIISINQTLSHYILCSKIQNLYYILFYNIFPSTMSLQLACWWHCCGCHENNFAGKCPSLVIRIDLYMRTYLVVS